MVPHALEISAMTTSGLTSNAQLFSYLCDLADELHRCNEADAAEAIQLARKFASGSPSEFLHESQLALKKVRSTCAGVLTPPQLEKLISVIEQIEDAFRDVGGA